MEALFALVLADGEELLERELEEAIADARERGWPIGVALASTISAWLHLRRGELALAAEEVRSASDIRAVHGATPLDPFVIAFDAWLRAEAGHPEEGLALIADGLSEEIPDAAVFQLSLLARGVLRIATGKREEGVDDVLLVGERELRFGGIDPLGDGVAHDRRGGAGRARRDRAGRRAGSRGAAAGGGAGNGAGDRDRDPRRRAGRRRRGGADRRAGARRRAPAAIERPARARADAGRSRRPRCATPSGRGRRASRSARRRSWRANAVRSPSSVRATDELGAAGEGGRSAGGGTSPP